MDWFTVDKGGLAKLLERRGKAFAIFELIQNAWDTNAKRVDVRLEPVEGAPYVTVRVEDDDPEGFKTLSHAFTLFAESEKKGDPTKRGRFNLGEKLVLALCRTAEISSTRGTVFFTPTGRRERLSARRPTGSEFFGEMRMTRDELAETLLQIRTLIQPEGVTTTVNGEPLPRREKAGTESAVLPTEVSDEEGVLRRSSRRTGIHMYEPAPGEIASLYELGIPVMETGDKYHVNVLQKVPLTLERDGVSPAYLRQVRAATLNTLYASLTQEESSSPWVRDAMASKEVVGAAVRSVMESRFGKDRVIFDPSDGEANNIAFSRGYSVIHGASLSSGEWENVRRYEAASPAGQVTPSPKPFTDGGRPLKMVEEMTPVHYRVVGFAQAIAQALLGEHVAVDLADDRGWNFSACYGTNHLTVNWSRVRNWVSEGDTERLVQLLIHEYAHHFESNHLADGFHRACCRLGAKLALKAASMPELVKL